tara:strand:+ start:1134 stop:1892 length:759 start_codon:yes stop_codon:yes gene_type:complete
MKMPEKPNNWKLEDWEDTWEKLDSLKKKKSAHWDAYRICSKWDKIINLPIVLLSSILSTGAISQTVAAEQNATIGYFISGASLLVTGLTTFSKYMNYGELKESHRQVSLNYYRLFTELNTKVQKRKDNPKTVEDESKTIIYTYEQFLEDYFTRITSIRENAPLLPSKVFINFLKDKNGIMGSDLAKMVVEKYKKHEDKIKKAEGFVKEKFAAHLDGFDDLSSLAENAANKVQEVVINVGEDNDNENENEQNS